MISNSLDLTELRGQELSGSGQIKLFIMSRPFSSRKIEANSLCLSFLSTVSIILSFSSPGLFCLFELMSFSTAAFICDIRLTQSSLQLLLNTPKPTNRIAESKVPAFLFLSSFWMYSFAFLSYSFCFLYPISNSSSLESSESSCFLFYFGL